MVRDGLTLLAMALTGKKALAFKPAYIDAFQRMEAVRSRLPAFGAWS
ncbi:Rha family transcriptional regulator [Comamonas thiooxydans]|nr:Rha family transcriptional regulator [Comamonas thiooxydans]